MISPGEFRSVLAAEPFAPFAVHMADGHSFHIKNPEYAAIDPQGRWVMAFKDDGSHEIAALLQVTGITVQAPKQPKGRTPKR